MLNTTLSDPTMLAFAYAFGTSAGVSHWARIASWNQAARPALTALWSLLPLRLSTNCLRVLRAMTLTDKSDASYADYTMFPKWVQVVCGTRRTTETRGNGTASGRRCARTGYPALARWANFCRAPTKESGRTK